MILPLADLLDAHSSERWLTQFLHPSGLRCPRCRAGTNEARLFRRGRRTRLIDYRCNRCDTVYNLYTGTFFFRKQLNPQQALLLLRGIQKGDSVMSIAMEVGVSRRSVYNLARCLRGNLGHEAQAQFELSRTRATGCRDDLL